MNSSSSYLRIVFWPVAAVLVCLVTATNPFLQPQIQVTDCLVAWFVDLAVVLLLSVHTVTARLGVLIAGLFLAIPCFIETLPLIRAWCMLVMAVPLLIALVPLYSPPGTDFRGRFAFFLCWFGTREIRKRSRYFHIPSLLHLILATVVLAVALAGVSRITPSGIGWLGRWLSGGVAMLAVAEIFTASQDFVTALLGIIAPSFMRSPCLSASVSEFWARRWNVAVSQLGFRSLCFLPAARFGIMAGLFGAFAASALLHALLVYVAKGQWGISLACGAFFLVQPLFILAERAMNIRNWPVATARLWTLLALAISSPLFIEPLIEVAASTLHAMGNTLWPTMAFLCFVILFNGVIAVGQLLLCPKTGKELEEAHF